MNETCERAAHSVSGSNPIPWRSVLAAAETVRLVIAFELLALRVPTERAAKLIADVAELTDLGDVEMVGAHVRQGATGIFAIIAPRREVIVDAGRAQDGVEGAGRRGAVPHFPIDAFGSRLGGQVARPGRAADADAHRPHLADPAAAHIFDRPAETTVEFR